MGLDAERARVMDTPVRALALGAPFSGHGRILVLDVAGEGGDPAPPDSREGILKGRA